MDYGFIEKLLFWALIIWIVYKSGHKNDCDDNDRHTNSTVIDANDLWHKNHDNDDDFGGGDGGDSGGSDGSDSND